MKDILFVTSNTGKVQSLARRLEGTGYSVHQKNLNLPEIQADNSADIAHFKALAAYQKLGAPVLVQDSSFHIDALNGFPGPYVKFINETIAVEGILRLMQGVQDRSCHFEQTLVYVDPTGTAYAFSNKTERGHIADTAHPKSAIGAWSDLWRIYIPDGYSKPLAALSEIERSHRSLARDDDSEFALFVRWLKKRPAV